MVKYSFLAFSHGQSAAALSYRRISMQRFPGTAVAVAVIITLLRSSTYGITIYNDRNLFVSAAGPNLHFEGFEDIPTDAATEGAISNGEVFGNGAFILDSLSLSTDVQVTASGYFGTFMVRGAPNPEINQRLGPGGIAGGSDPRDDDDFRITFIQPIRHFGILISENRIEPGENISLFAEDGSLILSAPLPGDNSGLGGNGFSGFILPEGSPYIKTVEIEEGQTMNDDMYFDWVYWDPVPEPSALTALGLTGLMLLRRRTS
jgi:hypothetical protein